ncbi:predicted protein [Arabidopsis lyrata subsp. lyrata]|uniref:Predicted protein n=1 Tax=Arabidopsis lyrata subsp. lyrata TaxID=81972 RepID=D7LAG5_ARALL|nr:predicted protein [Arabidopsis lyrata subsp. lyrata]
MTNKVIEKHKRVAIKSGHDENVPNPPKIANKPPKYMVDRICVTVKSSTGQESCTIEIPASIRHKPIIDPSTLLMTSWTLYEMQYINIITAKKNNARPSGPSRYLGTGTSLNKHLITIPSHLLLIDLKENLDFEETGRDFLCLEEAKGA